MTTRSFAQRFYVLVKQQRQALSAALIVALFMVLLGRVPVLPVLAGCALAIGISLMRSKTNFSVLKRVRTTR